MKKFLTLATMVCLLGLTSCKNYNQGYNAGVSDTTTLYKLAMGFIADVSSYYGATGSSMHLEFVKVAKDDKKYLVFKVVGYDDASYDWSTNTPVVNYTDYVAIDLSTYTPGQGHDSLINFLQGANAFGGLTDMGDGTFRCNVGCTDAQGNATTSSMVFEKSSVSLRDMETAAAFAEDFQIKLSADKLAGKFALSVDRAEEVATLLHQWNKISKNRAMTAADADSLAVELMGAKVSDVQKAFKKSLEGDASELNVLIDRAAEVNGVSSENMNQIVAELFL